MMGVAMEAAVIKNVIRCILLHDRSIDRWNRMHVLEDWNLKKENSNPAGSREK
jgi:hypothetical protein